MEAGRKGRLTQDDLLFGITYHIKEEEEMEAQESLTAALLSWSSDSPATG